MKLVTLDSSVIIASLLKEDKHHKKAKIIWEKVQKKEVNLILPATAIIEVGGAIKRRTNSNKFADEVISQITGFENINFIDINYNRAIETSKLAIQKKLRGMDAIFVQVSLEFNTELISFDEEMIKKSK